MKSLKKLASFSTLTVLLFALFSVVATAAARKVGLIDIATGGLSIGGTAVTSTGDELNYNDIASLGTGAASKTVVLDAGEDYTWPATGVLTAGVVTAKGLITADAGLTVPTSQVLTVTDVAGVKVGGVVLAATLTEVNNAGDDSARIVTDATAALAITNALHSHRYVVVTHTAAEATFTLPAATGSGTVVDVVVGAVNTNNHVIRVAAEGDLFEGTLLVLQDSADTLLGFESGASDDTITLNGTTTGGAAIGDSLTLVDIATNKWLVRGTLTGTSNEVTPFSNVAY